jgi:hypothetical protein
MVKFMCQGHLERRKNIFSREFGRVFPEDKVSKIAFTNVHSLIHWGPE